LKVSRYLAQHVPNVAATAEAVFAIEMLWHKQATGRVPDAGRPDRRIRKLAVIKFAGGRFAPKTAMSE
jgi:hypothetical protein